MYHTRQRQKVVEYFEKYPDVLLTAQTIMEKLELSKSTVYRILEHLVEIHFLKQIHNGDKRSDGYQLLSAGCSDHLHLVCLRCGEVIHLDCRRGQDFVKHLIKKHDFDPNLTQTVIYGICRKCKDKEKKIC